MQYNNSQNYKDFFLHKEPISENYLLMIYIPNFLYTFFTQKNIKLIKKITYSGSTALFICTAQSSSTVETAAA